MVCKWQVEKDDYARRILELRWPNVPKYRDVRYFLGSKRWRRVRAAWHVDVICGGFPCQDISTAGRRAGIDGERSSLWSEFARIVRLLRPRIVIVENVPALTIRGLGRVLGDLAKLGYDCEWDRIPAAAVGAPHLRWRIFIVAYAAKLQRHQVLGREPDGTCGVLVADSTSDGRQQGRQNHKTEGTGRRLADRGIVGADVSDHERNRWEQSSEVLRGRESVSAVHGRNDGGRTGRSGKKTLSDANNSRPDDGLCPGREVSRGGSSPDLADAESRWSGQRWREQFAAFCESQRNLYWADAQPPVCGVAHGVPNRVDRLRCLGNAVLPQVAEWIGRRIVESAST